MPQNFDHLRFSERQTCAPWAYALLGAIFVGLTVAFSITARKMGPYGPLYALFPFVVIGGATNLLCMRTFVDERRITVILGWLFPLYKRKIPLTEVKSAEAVTYNPIREYGGWGIRGFGRHRALNMRGNRGVQLVLNSGEHLLIGSGQPDKLLAAVRAGG